MPKRLWSWVSQRMSDCVGTDAAEEGLSVLGVAAVVVVVTPDFSSMIAAGESAESVESWLERLDDDDDNNGAVRDSTETTLGVNFPSR